MKRIVLTPVLEQYAQDYLEEIRNLIADKPETRLARLSDDLKLAGYKDEAGYVDIIYRHFPEIITATPEQMGNKIAPLFAACHGMNLSNPIDIALTAADGRKKQVSQKFYSLVVDALGYNEVQQKVFPKYIKKMGIKSCVYCNAQYAVAAKKGKTDGGKAYISTYTLDHYLPKSEYPYLASSFFNLYPCCSACNQAKSYKDPIFELYIKPGETIEKRNPFEFHLDSYSFVKYSMSGDADDLKVSLKPRVGIPQKELNVYEDYFHISKLAANYNDTIEEIIWKYRMYNKAGRKALYDSFSQLLPKTTVFNRFILGNYDQERDILKRPLAKLVQDVAKQLKII